MKYNDKIIALENQDNKDVKLNMRLKTIIKKYNPNLILCACRTRGETLFAIEIIRITTYQINNDHNLEKQIDYLLDLLLKLELI